MSSRTNTTYNNEYTRSAATTVAVLSGTMSSKTKQSSSCGVCMEEFTTSVRARVSCQQCSLDVCRSCVRLYLLNTSQQAHCMGPDCKSTWDREFLIDSTLRSFVNGDYKKHRATLILEQEKARLPETMPAVENYMKVGHMKASVKSDEEEMKKVLAQWRALKCKVSKDKEDIKRFERGETGKEEKRVFKQKCGVEDCLGFLSSAWKCGLCATWTCPKCFEVLGKEKECGHECNPNDVESAKLIKKETRNCPSCAIPIFKIAGCDQMWCTQCHIPFSWKSGLRVNGVVHNPHFYQWQRDGGGAAPIQTPGAQTCGGLPTIWQFRRQLNRQLTTDPYKSSVVGNLILKLHGGCAHFQHWELDRLRRNCQVAADNKPLRIKYLCKEITEKKFMQKLQQKDKMREKKLAQLQVCELLNTVFLENLNDIQQLMLANCTKDVLIETCLKNLDTCHKVRIYGNEQLAKISRIYNQSVGMVDSEFITQNRKYKKGSEVEDCFTKIPQVAAEFAFERAIESQYDSDSD